MPGQQRRVASGPRAAMWTQRLATEGLGRPELRSQLPAAEVVASTAGSACPASRWIPAAASSPA